MFPDTQPIQELTALVAAHGVFALVVIFIFYQQWRSVRNLNAAKGQNKAYFRKVHTSVVITTYVLIAISILSWGYATFFYSEETYVRGVVVGLVDRSSDSTPSDHPSAITQDITPEKLDTPFYVNKIDDDLEDGKYQLCWVLRPETALQTLVFRFQHRYLELNDRQDSEFFIPDDQLQDEPRHDSRILEETFKLNLENINYSASEPVRLIYEPHPGGPTKLGKMFVRSGGERYEIPWEGKELPKPIEEQASGLFHRLLQFPLFSPIAAHAFGGKSEVFARDGSCDPRVARLLRDRLASDDLKSQLQARRILVENGSRSIPFILETLKKGPKGSRILIYNLAIVVEEIQEQGTQFPAGGHVKLAAAFHELGDYESAGKFFDLGRAENVAGDLSVLARRAHTDYETGRYEGAIGDYQELLGHLKSPQQRARIHAALGASYQRLGRKEEAEAQLRRAIRSDKDYAGAYNNLAYLYAVNGEQLSEALALVNKALRLDPSRPQYLDTKGWVLFKMERYEEAIALLEEAAEKAPEDIEIADHLKAAREFDRP